MKSALLAALVLALVGGYADVSLAQDNSGGVQGSGSVKTDSGSGIRGEFKVEGTDKPAANPSGPSVGRDDGRNDGSALPRSAATGRTGIFGLSPTAAAIVGAAVLLVVILAIVAMTRSGPTYVERSDR